MPSRKESIRDLAWWSSDTGDPLTTAVLCMQNKQVARLCNMIRADSREFQADGRVLRLKQYISSDVRPAHIDAILDALAANTRVEVLYIQNFEWVSAAEISAMRRLRQAHATQVHHRSH